MARQHRPHQPGSRRTVKVSRLLGALLQRIGGWVRDYLQRLAAGLRAWAGLGGRPARADKAFQFEPLEARVLLSAAPLSTMTEPPAAIVQLLPSSIGQGASIDIQHQDVISAAQAQSAIFGELPGGVILPSLSLTDADGTRFTLSIAGKGSVSVSQDANGYRLQVTGSDAGTKLALVADGGDGRISLSGITVAGAIDAISMPAADLGGTIDIHGALRTLVLNNAARASISTSGSGLLDISAKVFSAVTLTTTQLLDELSLTAWNGTSALRAPALNALTVLEGMSADITLAGPGASAAASIRIGGAVGASQWSIAGRAASIVIGSASAGWRANIAGGVGALTVHGNASGLLATAGLGQLVIDGAAKGLTVLVGANLGSDAALGGSNAAADTFSPGSLNRIHIGGAVLDSLILVGVHPVNGKLIDGDDVMLGTAVNGVRELFIGGRLDAASHIVAPAFPASVSVNGSMLTASTLAQLSTRPLDWRAPTLAAHLLKDTGASASDGVTSQAEFAGRVTDGAVRLLGVLDPGAGMSVDLSANLHEDGSFTLPAAQWALADGAHTLRLQAEDAAGNRSLPLELRFVLDTAAPEALALDLAAASDSGTPGDHVTSLATVTLEGRTEAGAQVRLVGASQSILADAEGTFRLAGLDLAAGANSFTIELSDAAGNTRRQVISITRENLTSSPPPSDSAAPTLSAALANDTGSSAVDRITRDASIRGLAGDNLGVTRLQALLDPQGGAVPVVDVSSSLHTDGSFTLSPAQVATLAGGTLADGAHTLRLLASDAAGNRSGLVDVAFTLDTRAPLLNSVAFAAADASNAGATETAAAVSQLKGQAEQGATITLAGQALATVAGAGGTFVLPGARLALGANQLVLSASDVAGNTATLAQTLTRVAQQQRDAVLTWNDIALAAIKLDASDPAFATRVLAIQSIAVYDTLAAIEGTPAYLLQRSTTGPTSAQAAVTEAAYQVLYALYPGQRAVFDAARATGLAGIADDAAKTAGIALGKGMAETILTIRAADGYLDFAINEGSTALGKWRPTGPIYLPAQEPQWMDVTPFALDAADQFRPDAPPALDSAAYAASVEEVRRLGSVNSSERTSDQTQQVHFWADGGGSATPPGHWNQIASQVAAAAGNSLSANARLMAELNIALADSAIAAWDTKYTYGGWRPVTAIQQAGQDGNSLTTQDSTWQPLLITPPHPDYVSGHSTFSAAAATVLAAAFGDATAFSATSSTLPGVTRSFTSFSGAADEAGRSRIYAGIHFAFSDAAGQALGEHVAGAVLARFALTTDRQAPTVVLAESAPATHANLTLTGQVLDNLSGAASAEYRIDGGAPQPLVFDSTGRFAITTAFALNGSRDGEHAVTIIARDAAGNLSAGYTRRVVLDTRAPTISLTSLADGTLSAASVLTGAADATGSSLVSLRYSLDGGPAKSLRFDATSGSFDEALPLGDLGTGSHVLTLQAQDAAGNLAVLTRNVSQAALAPFTLTRVTPYRDELEVGVTYRPQVFFSRAVDPATLTADSFYATGPDGQKLATTIVPALDGSFAWLFFNSAMPGSSRVTLHLDGAAVRAKSDNARLTLAGDGPSGSQVAWSFTTVSTTTVPGTKLVGKIVDPGADLEPMTFDDIRRGPDGIIHTADDVFLNPIAHVQVSIVGRPDLVTFTDANGNFAFDETPVGQVKVTIDGRTASNAPVGVFFPEMVMALELRAGVTNTMMGTMGTIESQVANLDRKEVYLPRIQSAALQQVSNTGATTITVNDTSAPELTEEQRGQLAITVAPGSAVGANGQVLGDVRIGISTVPSAMVKDMLPIGLTQYGFNITIQAPGVSTFTTPLQITFPNVFNAAPGTKLDILSFDHTTGMLVINGSGTVSADGKTVTSDPDSGIMAPGWHSFTPPGDCGADGDAPPEPKPPKVNDTEETLPPRTLDLITDDGENFSFEKIEWSAEDGESKSDPLDNSNPDCPPDPQDLPYLKVTVEVNGPLADFMKSTGDVDLEGDEFILRAGSGETRTLNFTPIKVADMGELGMKGFETNVLYASTIKVTKVEYLKDGSTKTTIENIFVSRYIDATDDEHTDQTTTFSDVINDGANGNVRTVGFKILAGDGAQPDVDVTGAGFSNVDFFDLLQLDPSSSGQANGKLTVKNPDGGASAGAVALTGWAAEPDRININQAGLISQLEAIANSSDPEISLSERQLVDTPEKRAAVASEVASAAMNYFAPFGKAIQKPGGSADAVIDVGFTTTDDATLLGEAVNMDFLGILGPISRVVQDSPKYSDAENAFRLDQGVAASGRVEVYPTQFFKRNSIASSGQLVDMLANVIAHETGHQLGLLHSSLFKGGSLSAEIVVDGARGHDDVMTSRGQLTLLSFTKVTFDALRLIANASYVVSDAMDAMSYYKQYMDKIMPGELNETASGADSPAGAVQPPLFAPGPRLLLQNATLGDVLRSRLDMGTTPVDGAGAGVGTVPLLFTNVGTDQDLVFDQAAVTGNGFALSGLAAGTRIAPGASITAMLSFDPLTVGSASGTLTIHTNDAHAETSIALSAFGQGAHAHATVELANNNFGGVDATGAHEQTKTVVVRNDGAEPLIVSAIAVTDGAADFSLTNVQARLANGPVSLAFGESLTFDVRFDPRDAGLTRGAITVTSNDPATPRLRLGVVGTGYNGVHHFAWGEDYVAVDINDNVLRAESDAGGHFGFFLRSNSAYRSTVFDPASGLVAHGHGTTPPAGRGTDLSSGLVFAPSVAPDSDGDGLPDDIELAIGSSPTSRDSNHDGVDDFVAIGLGIHPLEGQRTSTGLLSATALAGPATSVVVTSQPGNVNRLTAYVGTGSAGLAIVDVSEASRPVILAQLDLPGTVSDVAVDPAHGMLALAAGSAGLHLVSIATPAAPALRQTVNLGAPVSAVLTRDGLAYAANGSAISVVDLATGAALATFSQGGPAFTGLALEGDVLYASDAGGNLNMIRIDGADLSPLSSQRIGSPTNRLVVANGIAYLADERTAGGAGGYMTVNVRDPRNPIALGANTSLNSYPGKSVAISGAARVLTVGNALGPNAALIPALDIFNSADPATTVDFLTRIALPSTPQQVTLAHGLAFVANGTSGLLIAAYGLIDTKGIAPTVSLDLAALDIDPATPGIQVLEGSAMPIRPEVSDDVQVNAVELLVNGTAVTSSASFPFDFPTITAAGGQDATSLTLQARATDSAGNSALSQPVVVDLVRTDRFGPRLTDFSIAEGQHIFAPRRIDLIFSEPLDINKLDASAVTLTSLGADGLAGTGDDQRSGVTLEVSAGARRLSILPIGTLAAGAYRLSIDPASLTDRVGNAVSSLVVRNFVVLASTAIRAASGSAALPGQPSANVGQEIAVPVPFAPAGALATFQVIDGQGRRTPLTVTASHVDAANSIAWFTVPYLATTGDVVVYSMAGGARTDGPQMFLQIVPTIASVDAWLVSGGDLHMRISGTGFARIPGSEYRIGATTVVDDGGLTINSPFLEGAMYVTVPLTDAASGPISFKTSGGTSAAFTFGDFSIDALAFSGTPARAELPSANPGQPITVRGAGLSLTTQFLLRSVDTGGQLKITVLKPDTVANDGASAVLTLPDYANGAFALQVLGAASAPLLQVVPTLSAFGREDDRVLSGRGLVEGASTYQFNGYTVTDNDPNGSADVGGGFFNTNGVSFPASVLPHHGAGDITVTTAGGTSAPLATAQLGVEMAAPYLDDVAIDPSSGAIWVVDSASPRHLRRIDPANGLALQTISIPKLGGLFGGGSSSAGLQVLAGAMSLGSTSVPAGSLLLFDGSGSPDRVLALDPVTGSVLATLNLDPSVDLTTGRFDPASGHLFVIARSGNRLLELDAASGALRNTVTLSIAVQGGVGMAFDPVTNNLWIGSSSDTPQLIELTRTGAEVRRVDLSSQGLARSSISGLAFRPDGTLLVASSSGGALHPVLLDRDTAATVKPALATVVARPTSGVAADAGVAAANVGDVVELRGAGFGLGTSVLFPTRDEEGRLGAVNVVPFGISADGTRLQVRVPDFASTGDVRVVNRGSNLSRPFGFSQDGEYSVYRQVSVNFIAGTGNPTIRFANGRPDGTTADDWGLDNVSVKQGTASVFADDFESGAKLAWSSAQTDASELALLTRYSGGFSTGTGQALTLNGLTPGQTYTLSFDLYQLYAARDSGSADLFDVSVDGASILRESLSGNTYGVQTINGSNGLRLQVVPTLKSYEPPSADGLQVVYLEGSGFIKGGTTLTVGGVSVSDTTAVGAILRVGGDRNDVLQMYGLHLIDGPVRVSTEGGYAEVPARIPAQPASTLTGIAATALAGVPADPARPSALSGQTITLSGSGFTYDSLVQFPGTDDSGMNGVLTRRGAPNANGTALTVSVPALARSGAVTVVGSNASINLQIVPILRAVGGSVAAGQTIVLEGSGLSAPDVAIRIDGIPVSGVVRQTVQDGVSDSTGSSGFDQQLVSLVVPAGVSAGTITVTSSGGQFALTAAATHLASSSAVAASGTPARTGIASANAGQSITLHGTGLLAGDKVVFTTSGEWDQFGTVSVTPDALDLNGQTITVTVPQAAITGAVRLERDATGILLQLVPRVSQLTVASAQLGDNSLILSGSGFGPGATVLNGPLAQPYQSDGFNISRRSSGEFWLDRAQAAPTGPIRVSTVGGTSAALDLHLASIQATAASGSAPGGSTASANAGQRITVTGSGLSAQSGIVFDVIDNTGQRGSFMVRPVSVNTSGTEIVIAVPMGATSGNVRLMGSADTVALQIVPTVTGVRIRSISGDGASALIELTGSGFVEGNFSEYRLGSQLQVDSGPGGGADVWFDTTTNSNLWLDNGSAALTVPLTDSGFGPITVKTNGGTSAAYQVSLAAIDSVALSGSAADAGQASANAGQTVTLRGSGLSKDTNVLLRWVDAAGAAQRAILKPASAAADGSSALLSVPYYANGAFTLQVFGSSSQPLLQIVPTVTAFSSNGNATLTGSGFVEGASAYQFPGLTSTDASISAGASVTNENRTAELGDATLPNYGDGLVTVTTAGGTSAGLRLNQIRVQSAHAFGDMAIDPTSGALWMVDMDIPAHLLRIDGANGEVLQSITVSAAFGPTYLSTDAGLQVLGQGITLGSTTVPAGSLLLFSGDASPDRVVAVNPASGAVIASLSLAGNYQLTAGLFDPSSGHLFVTENAGSRNRLLELNPLTGALINAATLPTTVGWSAALALDPVSGNLWLATADSGVTLFEITRGGTEVRRVALGPQGVGSATLSGLAFAPDGSLWVATASDVIVYRVHV